MGRGNFEGEKGCTIVKYMDAVVICAKKVEPIKICLDCGLGRVV